MARHFSLVQVTILQPRSEHAAKSTPETTESFDLRSFDQFSASTSPVGTRRVTPLNRQNAHSESRMIVAQIADDLDREVHGFLGIPVDAVDLSTVLSRISNAAETRARLLISTANINFLTTSLHNPEFRDSLLSSDLCTADGMPIVWLSRLFGIPLKERVSGASIFFAIKNARTRSSPLSIFLFGGAVGVASTAAATINAEPCGLTCVGYLEPGFLPVDELSTASTIDAINASGADFLSASLGAAKGQAWLMRNKDRLKVPVLSHLGATINFQAGTIKRAPVLLQKIGFEWIWRIKEEPYLWRRYFNDFCVLLGVVLTSALPIWAYSRLSVGKHALSELSVERAEDTDVVILTLNGAATARTVTSAIPQFRAAIASGKNLVVDLAGISFVDTRFLGLLLMVRKILVGARSHLVIASPSKPIRRLLKLHKFDFLLSS
jgi:N-acetylglucosaminyldiphosphoundecaprenol N-acetyl-beta-D-mannosaminyltransferase